MIVAPILHACCLLNVPAWGPKLRKFRVNGDDDGTNMSCSLCFVKLDQTINLSNFEYKETMTDGIFYSYCYQMLAFLYHSLNRSNATS